MPFFVISLLFLNSFANNWWWGMSEFVVTKAGVAGPVCEEYGVWLHVDGAYAGNSFICPELRGPMKGIEVSTTLITPFNDSLNKLLTDSAQMLY